MGSPLYDIVKWTETTGEVKALDRLRVMVLPDLLAEGLMLAEIDADTSCSPELLDKFRESASKVVGEPCPA